MEAENPVPPVSRTWRSSRCSPRARKILVVNPNCAVQSSMMARPKKLCPQAFMPAATCSAAARNTSSPAIARRRLRWLSSDMVVIWPSASSPSNIQPSAPDSSAYAALRMLRSTGALGLAAGPVPWIHCRCRSCGISLPANRPSRAACTPISVPAMVAPGSRKPIRSPSRARRARRSMRSRISRRRCSLNPARACSASSTSGV